MTKRTLVVVAITFITFAGCKGGEAPQTKYTTVDGSEFVVGDSYRYLGEGRFEHQKVIKWEDLKK